MHPSLKPEHGPGFTFISATGYLDQQRNYLTYHGWYAEHPDLGPWEGGVTPAGLSPGVLRGWQFSRSRVTEYSCTFIFHEASLAVGNHWKAILKAADVEDLATGLSIRGCEDSGPSIAAVGSLGSLGPGVPGGVAETRWLYLAEVGAGCAGTDPWTDLATRGTRVSEWQVLVATRREEK